MRNEMPLVVEKVSTPVTLCKVIIQDRVAIMTKVQRGQCDEHGY